MPLFLVVVLRLVEDEAFRTDEQVFSVVVFGCTARCRDTQNNRGRSGISGLLRDYAARVITHQIDEKWLAV